MTYPPNKTNIKIYCSYVIMAFLFSLPFSTSVSNLLAILIVILWLTDRNFKEKFKEISQNKIALAVLAYVLLHIIGLLWTNDMSQGLMIFKKQWKLLLMPIFLNMTDKKHTRYYIFSFLTAMAISVGLSYLVWFDLLEIKHASPQNPTPFISRIVYGPFLAFAIYIAMHEVLFTSIGKLNKSFLAFIVCSMIVNMAITDGRTGYIAFFLLMLLLPFQYFKKQLFMAILVAFLAITTTFSAGYMLSPKFQERISDTITNLKLNGAEKTYLITSVEERITFLTNSVELTQNNPFLGVGTGDFADEYKKINEKNSPTFSATDNPHNQYLRVSSQFGVIGLITFLSIFFYQIRLFHITKDKYSHLRFAFTFFYMVIFLGDSYLQTNTTTLLFSSFSGFLFKTTMFDQ